MSGLSLGVSVTGPQGVEGPGGPPPSPPATISLVTVGMFSGGTLPVTIVSASASAGDGVYWVLEPSGSSAPTATEVRLGQASGGGAPIASGDNVWPGPFSVSLGSGLARGDYILHVVIDNGALSNVGVSTAFLVDTVAPVLSAPGTSDVAGTTATLGVTTNDTIGTLYAGVWPTAATPTAAEIIAGTGAIFHDSAAPPVAGANTFAATGLTASTAYRAWFAHVDDFGNTDTDAGAEFTTVGSSSYANFIAGSLADTAYASTTSGDHTVDLTGYNGTDDILVLIPFSGARTSGGDFAVASLTLNGQSPTSFVSQGGFGTVYLIAYAVFPAGSYPSTPTLAWTAQNGTMYGLGACAYEIPPAGTVTQIASAPSESFPSTTVRDVSGNVSAGDTVVAAAINRSATTAWTGVAQDQNATFSGLLDVSIGVQSDVVAATPMTIAATRTPDDLHNWRFGALSVRVS